MSRPYSSDIESVEPEMFEDHREYMVLKTTREGIYDMLPQGLFHEPALHKSTGSEKDITDAIKKRRVEEQSARNFFVPFESAINSIRVDMAIRENMFDKYSHYDELVNIFSDHWEIFRYLDARQSTIFLYLLPILHDIRDDHPNIVEIMEMIFLIDVHLDVRPQGFLYPEQSMMSKLSENVLGVDLTTGNMKYEDGLDELILTIGPMDAASYQGFLPGGRNKMILDLLCDYLLPVSADLIVKIELSEDIKQARLAIGSIDEFSKLGQDMILMS